MPSHTRAPKLMSVDFRRLVTQPDLNSHGTLHGGILMKWSDECAGMHARKSTGFLCVTRYIDKINFVSTARIGTILRITSVIESIGNSSLTFRITVRNDLTNNVIATIDRLVFVCVDGTHKPINHGLKLDDD